MANENLSNAKRAKNDEFYTQWHDIETEVNAYLDFDPGAITSDCEGLMSAHFSFPSKFIRKKP